MRFASAGTVGFRSKDANDTCNPLEIVYLRVLFGFLPVLIYAYLSGALALNHLKHAGHFLVMPLLATTLYYYAFVKGTSLLLSGVVGAVSGSIPLFSFALAILFLPEEKINGSRIKIYYATLAASSLP